MLLFQRSSSNPINPRLKTRSAVNRLEPSKQGRERQVPNQQSPRDKGSKSAHQSTRKQAASFNESQNQPSNKQATNDMAGLSNLLRMQKSLEAAGIEVPLRRSTVSHNSMSQKQISAVGSNLSKSSVRVDNKPPSDIKMSSFITGRNGSRNSRISKTISSQASQIQQYVKQSPSKKMKARELPTMSKTAMPKQESKSQASVSQLHVSKSNSSALHVSGTASSRVSSLKEMIVQKSKQITSTHKTSRLNRDEESSVEAGSSADEKQKSTIIEEHEMEEEGHTSSDAGNGGVQRRFMAYSAVHASSQPITNSDQRNSAEATSLYSGGNALTAGLNYQHSYDRGSRNRIQRSQAQISPDGSNNQRQKGGKYVNSERAYSQNTAEPATVKSGSTAYGTNVMMSTAIKNQLHFSPIIANQREMSNHKHQSLEASYISRKSQNAQLGAMSQTIQNNNYKTSALGSLGQRLSQTVHQNKRRKRYNPNEDPNFSIHSPQFQNDERYALQQAELHANDDQLSMEFEDPEGSNQITDGDVSASQSDNEQRAIVSGIKKKQPKNAKERRNRVIRGKACDLLATNQAKNVRVSQIGGGKAFRQSQVNGMPSNMSITHQSGIGSRIKQVTSGVANLSVIESEEDDEDQSPVDESDQTEQSQVKQLTTIGEGSKETPGDEMRSRVKLQSIAHDMLKYSKANSSVSESVSVSESNAIDLREPGSSDSSVADETESYESLSDYKEDSNSAMSAFNTAGYEGSSQSMDSAYYRAKDRFKMKLAGYHRPTNKRDEKTYKSFRYHKLAYKKFLTHEKEDKLAREVGTVFEESEQRAIFTKLKRVRLPCLKYNHCLDQSPFDQNISFQAFIQVEGPMSDPYLRILNRVAKQDNIKYILSSNTDQIKNEVQMHLLNRSQRKKVSKKDKMKSNSGIRDSGAFEVFNGDQSDSESSNQNSCRLDTELDEEIDQIQFDEKNSGASCRVNDIKGIIFGGVSSRFWILRKHISSLDAKDLKQLPFYAWECLTLQLKNRDIDLVIRDPLNMELFLKFLIYQLKTVDGNRDSALPILEKMNEKIDRRNSVSMKFHLEDENERQLFRSVFKKYRMMAVRSKISFMALQNCVTIQELICKQIVNSYRCAVRHGHIDRSCAKKKVERDIYFCLLKDGLSQLKDIVGKFIDSEENDSHKHVCEKQTCSYAYVIKNGVEKKVPVKNEKQKTLLRKVELAFSKNDCLELFRDLENLTLKDDKAHNAKTDCYKDFVTYRMKKIELTDQFNRLNLMVKNRLLGGLLFVKVLIMRNEVRKKLLILDVELGREVFIPTELSQDNLPLSFRYYDFILRFIQTNISNEKRERFNMQKQLALAMHGNSTMALLKRIFGVDHKDEEKLYLGQTAVNEAKRKDIDYRKSTHAKEIQRSRYVQIDDNILNEDMLRNEPNPEDFRMVTNMPDGDATAGNQHAAQVNVKYLHAKDVSDKRQASLISQRDFLVKQNHLKACGQKIKLMNKVSDWLAQNGEKLIRSRSQSMNLKQQSAAIDALWKQAESMVRKSSVAARKKTIEGVKEATKRSQPYEKRLKFVQDKIKADDAWFRPGDASNEAKQLLKNVEKITARRKRNERLRESAIESGSKTFSANMDGLAEHVSRKRSGGISQLSGVQSASMSMAQKLSKLDRLGEISEVVDREHSSGSF